MLNIILSLWPIEKYCLTNLRNYFPTFLFTLLEYGRSNQIIFCFPLFFFSLPCLSTFSLTYSSFSWNPLFFRASSCMGIDSLNICSLKDVSKFLLLTNFVGCCRTVGGWFEFLFKYTGLSFGFRYGLWILFIKSKVVSRRFTTQMFLFRVRLVLGFWLNLH